MKTGVPDQRVPERNVEARDVMTADYGVVHPGTSLLDAAALMVGTGLCHLVVVDQDRRVVGLLRERDLDAHVGGHRPVLHGEPAERLRGNHVGDVMVSPPFIAGEQTSLVELAMELACRDVDVIPVVDGAAQLVGVVWPTVLEERLARLT